MKTVKGFLSLLVLAAAISLAGWVEGGQWCAHAGVTVGMRAGHVWHGDGAGFGSCLGYWDGQRCFRHWPYTPPGSYWGYWSGYPWSPRYCDPWHWDDGWCAGRGRGGWRCDEELRRREVLESDSDLDAERREPRPREDFPDLIPRIARILEENKPGESETWRVADDGRALTVTPGAKREGREYTCRDYIIVSEREGERHGGFVTACKTKEGNWRLADQK